MRASDDDRVICDKCPICTKTIDPLKLKSRGTRELRFDKLQVPTSHRRCFGGMPAVALDVSLPGPFKVTLTQKVTNELGLTSTHSHTVELRRFSE